MEQLPIRPQMRRWDLFCKVVDNYGDIGTCWRLARQLTAEHQVAVRLWVDNLESFARLCPSLATDVSLQRIDSVEICHWRSEFPAVDVADVVIEAFACEIPASYIATMKLLEIPPVWINLEYLTAESWVEDCHLLTSVQSRSPLKKHFFFPGFTTKTGGLLREADLLEARAAFNNDARAAFWWDLGVPLTSAKALSAESCANQEFENDRDELRVSLFCYNNPAVKDLLQSCADGSVAIHVLTAPGAATDQASDWFGEPLKIGQRRQKGMLTVTALPFLLPTVYDRLLWACDVNFVRGEDSFVRAQWAQQPFVWQIYPQDENAHLGKLDAFLARYLNQFGDSSVVRRCFHAWNGTEDMRKAWPDFLAQLQTIQRHGKVWGRELDRAGNLADNLVSFGGFFH